MEDKASGQAGLLLSTLKIYIIQAKMDAKQMSDLVELVGISGASLCSNPHDSEVVITTISMRRRLERHLSWDIAVCISDRISRQVFANL